MGASKKNSHEECYNIRTQDAKERVRRGSKTRMSELLVMNAWRSSFRSLRPINPATSDFIIFILWSRFVIPLTLHALTNSPCVRSIHLPSSAAHARLTGNVPYSDKQYYRKHSNMPSQTPHNQGCFQLCRAMRSENSKMISRTPPTIKDHKFSCKSALTLPQICRYQYETQARPFSARTPIFN
jgi:hypothetical protein